MLGDSVRRNLGRSAGGKKPGTKGRGRRPGLPGKWWMWIAALAIPFGLGWLVATQVLFPKPAVVAEGTPVPQLVGRSLADAGRELRSAGLGATLATELPNADVPAGVITAQSPLAGQQARAGASVRVAVSSGTPKVAVPDVRGFSEERARTLLRGLGFEVADTVEESSLPAGRVSGIEPGAGAVLQLPATVRLFVSSGPPPDTMAVDTMRVRTDTLAARWPAVPAGPIFAGET